MTHVCACHVNCGVLDDRDWLMSTRPAMLSTWLCIACPMADTLRWLFTCDTEVHCACPQMFIRMPLVESPVPDLPVFPPISPTSQPGHLPLSTCPSTYHLTLANYLFTQSGQAGVMPPNSDHLECFSLLLPFKAIKGNVTSTRSHATQRGALE